MATVKMTFTLDQETARKLNGAAQLHRKPKSHIVSEAIASFYEKKDCLAEAERRRRLAVWDDFLIEPMSRSQAEVERELKQLRDARRSGGRLHPAE